MSSTFAQLVNEVLVLLRESEVSTFDETEYSLLVSRFINQTKREVEDSWDWSSLRTTVTFNTTSDVQKYTMDGITSDIAMGDRFKIFNIVDDDNDIRLRPVDYRWLKYHNLLDVQTTEQPIYYILESAVSGNPVLQLYPTPNSAYTIYIHAKVPQADFDDSADVLKVPKYPVVLGAYAKALRERGEDAGASAQDAQRDYMSALSDAIAFDVVNYSSENTWTVV